MVNKYKLFKLSQDDLVSYIAKGVENAPCVLYGTYYKPYAFICEDELCDYEYIKSHNIEHTIFPTAKGSTIVCSSGDIGLAIFGDLEFCSEMFNRVSGEFSRVLNGGKFINNDFMYNGYKHGASTSMTFGDVEYVAMHISNEIDKELISKICKKDVKKIPEKLPHPITEKDVEKIFSDGDKQIWT